MIRPIEHGADIVGTSFFFCPRVYSLLNSLASSQRDEVDWRARHDDRRGNHRAFSLHPILVCDLLTCFGNNRMAVRYFKHIRPVGKNKQTPAGSSLLDADRCRTDRPTQSRTMAAEFADRPVIWNH